MRPAARGRSESAGAWRQAVLWQGWREGTYRRKIARQLEPGSPAMAPTTMMKLPPRKSEDTCQGSAWRRAERSPPGTVERQNAQLGQDLQLILLGCEVRDQGTQTSQAWCGLQGVLHRDLPGSAGGLASDGIAVRVTRPESHLCANAAPTVWNRARPQLCTGWLPPAHAKLRVRSRTTISRPHPIFSRLFTTQ